MKINLSLDSSVSRAPSNFVSLLNQGVQFLEQTFVNPITITIQIGWQEIAGFAMPSNVVGQAGPLNGNLYTYNQVKAALAGNISSTADATSVSNLPGSDPTNNGKFFIASSEEKALGLISPSGGGIDGAAGFQGTIGVGVVIHELTHAMGRIDFLGQRGVTQSDVGVFGLGKSAEYSILDLFRYTGSGALRPTAAAAYFSIDGGRTQINTYDPTDPADWNNRTNDAFNSIYFGPNVPDPVTLGDLQEMDVLGFALANPTVTGTVLNLPGIPVTVLGAPGETINASFDSAVINGLGGGQTINGGNGPMTVFAAAGDSVTAGSGGAYIDGSSGSVVIVVGSAGSNTIVGSVAPVAGASPDTILGGAASVLIQGLGKGDIVNFSNQIGPAQINATAGNNKVMLGSGTAAVYGGAGDTITLGTGDQLATAYSGGAQIFVGSAGNDSVIGSVARVSGVGADTIFGGAAAVVVQGLGSGDIVSFGGQTGTAAINATTGNNAVTLGSGIASVFGGIGDTITFGSGNQYAEGLTGGTTFVVGAAGSDTIVGSAFRAPGAGVDTLIGGAAAVLVQGLGQGDIVNFTNQTGSAAINATAGNNAVTLGGGAASVYGGIGGSIVMGSGAQLASALTGAAAITVGTAGGSDTIVGSVSRANGVAADTIVGGAASVIVSSLAAGDIVNFANQTGSATINATAGSNPVTLGSGAATVFAGANDIIKLGTGNQYIDASFAAGAQITLGAAGAANLAGSALANAGSTIKGSGGAALIYNAGGGSDLIDLTGSTGTAVINGLGTDKGVVNDTIVAGNGGTTVFGGQGNRIGVGANTSGANQFFHSTTINGAAMGFGTNGSGAGTSSAQVTVTGFAHTGGTPTDFLFYQNPSDATTTSIVASSTQVTPGGVLSTQLTLPDGTVMTLVGIAKADFNNGYFKA